MPEYSTDHVDFRKGNDFFVERVVLRVSCTDLNEIIIINEIDRRTRSNYWFGGIWPALMGCSCASAICGAENQRVNMLIVGRCSRNSSELLAEIMNIFCDAKIRGELVIVGAFFGPDKGAKRPLEFSEKRVCCFI